jgi:hypothetical protein
MASSRRGWAECIAAAAGAAKDSAEVPETAEDAAAAWRAEVMQRGAICSLVVAGASAEPAAALSILSSTACSMAPPHVYQSVRAWRVASVCCLAVSGSETTARTMTPLETSLSGKLVAGLEPTLRARVRLSTTSCGHAYWSGAPSCEGKLYASRRTERTHAIMTWFFRQAR